jgi:hypothetical protein
MNAPFWFELAVMLGIYGAGNIFFGHFEERTPRWRKVVKLVFAVAVTIAVSSLAGRVWFFCLLAAVLLAVVWVHAWWLPRHGINGWTGEPRDRYYALRGWKQK